MTHLSKKTIFIQSLEVFVSFAFVKWLGKNGNSILMGLVTEQYAWMDLSIVDHNMKKGGSFLYNYDLLSTIFLLSFFTNGENVVVDWSPFLNAYM